MDFQFLKNLDVTHLLSLLLFFAFIIQSYYYLRYYGGIIREKKLREKGKRKFNNEQPPVTVIVCAKNESENIKRFLPSILEQEYPDFEVVVINDGSTDATSECLTRLKAQYKNLYETYIPASAEIISRKKLAITIGVKAAKNDLLLFTDADCQTVDKHWISSMVRNFTPETEIVLGYGSYFPQKRFLSKMISYDTLFIVMQYMGFALAGHPYMGVGRNLAYRKRLFLEHKGFAGMLHLQSGDDDLLVNAWANKKNTRIEIAKESVTQSLPKQNFRQWIIQRERHLSTSANYKKGALNRIGCEVTSRGLFYLFFILSLSFWSMIPGIIALSLFIVRYCTQIIVINGSAKILNDRKFYASILLFDIILPLINLHLLLKQHFFHKKNHQYKWK